VSNERNIATLKPSSNAAVLKLINFLPDIGNTLKSQFYFSVMYSVRIPLRLWLQILFLVNVSYGCCMSDVQEACRLFLGEL